MTTGNSTKLSTQSTSFYPTMIQNQNHQAHFAPESMGSAQLLRAPQMNNVSNTLPQQQQHHQSNNSTALMLMKQQQLHRAHQQQYHHQVTPQELYHPSNNVLLNHYPNINNNNNPHHMMQPQSTSFDQHYQQPQQLHQSSSNLGFHSNQQFPRQLRQNATNGPMMHVQPHHVPPPYQPSSSSSFEDHAQWTSQHLSMAAPSTDINNSFFSKSSPVSMHRHHLSQVQQQQQPYQSKLLFHQSFASSSDAQNPTATPLSSSGPTTLTSYDPWTSKSSHQSPQTNFNMWSSHTFSEPSSPPNKSNNKWWSTTGAANEGTWGQPQRNNNKQQSIVNAIPFSLPEGNEPSQPIISQCAQPFVGTGSQTFAFSSANGGSLPLMTENSMQTFAPTEVPLPVADMEKMASPKKSSAASSKLNYNAQPFIQPFVPKTAPQSPSRDWFENIKRSSQGPSSPNAHNQASNAVHNVNNKGQGSPSKSGQNKNAGNNRGKPARVLSFNAEPDTLVNAPPVETSHCRQMYKDFLKDMKQILEEAKGEDEDVFETLKQFVVDNIEARVPNTIWWRVYLFLAEHAKRHNFITEARNFYKKVNTLQPTASQGWLEHAKLEEECGNLQRCKYLINCGLQYCQTNENLLIKGIKQYAEQLNDMNGARALLSRLRGVPLEKCWKIMLEGALLESRVGNIQIARRVFKHLMQNVSRHGPVYYEAYRLEERMEQYDRALQIVEKGLFANPRYGPLWFAALRLYEKLALIACNSDNSKIDLTKVRDCIQRAVENISKELIWKVWFESAQIEERAGNLDLSRKSYTRSVMTCMKNLRWKVWLAGSRTELNFGNMEISRMLLSRALTEVPAKTKAVVLIECARLEEYSSDINKAREYLQRAQKEARHEWKVYLESILLEMRAGQIQRAIAEAEKALEIHRSTGRLWAVLIQLKQCEGEEEQMRVFKQALSEVPKSGEVWCEGARIRLNPLSPRFHLQKARQYLEFAIKFTPQYGDSFIEYLRLELLSKGPRMGKHHYSVDGDFGKEEEEGNIHIEQLCVNADPNYGPLWFHCKSHALDSSRLVLVRAKDLLIAELLQYRTVYQRAIMREYSPREVVEDSESDEDSNNEESSDDEESITAEHFTTGLFALQRLYNKSHTMLISDELRKKYIFGSESPGGLVL